MSAADQSSMAIRTKFGPVNLRRKRLEPQRMKLAQNPSVEAVIKKAWLKDCEKSGVEYHRAVKQAMLIAVEQVKANDAADPNFGTPQEVRQAEQKIKNLVAGQAQIPVSAPSQKKSLGRVSLRQELRERDLMIKFSKSSFLPQSLRKRMRTFVIHNGELLVYYGLDQQARQRNHYSLQDATFVLERRNSSQYPAWEEGFTQRLRVSVKERESGPVYLYPPSNEPDGNSKMKMWKRAFSLAKVLTSDNDRKALKVCIGRAASGSCTKGWEALVSYYKELAHIKKLVRNMAMRLMKVDLSRGFTKMRLCYRKRKMIEKQMEERQLAAARIMSERLGRLGVQNAKSAADVRDTAISAIQRKFRHYRDDKIFDSKYPLNSSSHNKLQQAKLGRVVNFDLKANTCDTSLKLTLDEKSRKEYDTSKEAFLTKRSTYSETNLPVNSGHIFVSDNLSCLSFSYNPDERVTMQHSAMTKADWSKFINMDRISSIVMYTDPMCGASLASPGSVQEHYRDEGVWFSINGPRIGFGKTLENYEKVRNGFQIAEQLMTQTGQQTLPWVTVEGKIASAKVELPQDIHVIEAKANGGAAVHHKDAEPKTLFTFARIHILGYTFTTAPTSDYSYHVSAVASVPVHFEPQYTVPAPEPPAGTKPADDAPKTVTTEPYFALDLLKSSVIGVEIYQGKPEGDHQLFLVGSEPLKLDGGVESNRPVVKVEPSQTIPLRSPEVPVNGKQDGSNSITLSLSAQVTVKQKQEAVPMSPELAGLGITTALFTSHRGCWYDPVMGLGKFSVEHVPNYIDIKVNGLGLPNDDTRGKLYKYRVVASVCNFSASTHALTRPKQEWKEVLGAASGDHTALKFGGSRLCVPLPPGIWCENSAIGGDSRRAVDFKVMRYEIPVNQRPVKYGDFKRTANNGRSIYPEIREEPVYFGRLLIGKVPADMEKHMTIYLAADPKKVNPVDSFTNFTVSSAGGSGADQGILNIEFSLRDRDYVRATMSDPMMRRALVIGDRAMLMVEETLSTTPDKQQKKIRFYKKEEGSMEDEVGPNQSKPRKEEKPKYPGHVQLREPCLSSEYAESGLGELPMKVPFLPTMIPNFCTDVIPHKYVLPNTEHSFNRESRPGIWWRVVDHLHETWQQPDVRRRSLALGTKNQPKHIVEHLSHLVKNIPVTILAVYDGFADVEISDSFMDMWSEHTHSSRMFNIPGELWTAPGDLKNNVATTRHILMRVPTLYLRGVHVAGINVYDAQYSTTKQMLTSTRPPTYPFQPSLSSQEATRLMENKSGNQATQARVVAHPRFTVQAGPMPADAGPSACQYEWSLRLRAASEAEMHQFVALMRRVVRMDNHAQSSKMMQYQTQVAENTAFAVQPANRPTNGGQLDVLLVEARRLKGSNRGNRMNPWREGLLENFLPKLMGTTSGDTPKLTPDWREWVSINTVVNFRMLSNLTVIPFKGRLTQQSDPRGGTSSPSWTDLTSKGHLFKTGLIVPEKVPDLLVDFEVLNVRQPACAMTRIGAIQLPVHSRQFLTNPAEPFRNLWLPLLSVKDGKRLSNPIGELHVMTRWLPADKMPIAGSGINAQTVSVRGHFMKELFHKMIQKRVREPVFQLEANFHQHYNPNLVRGPEKPELPKDHTKRHTELLEDSLAYLHCLDRRAGEAWDNFINGLPEDLRGARVGELYLKWIDDGDSGNREALKDLIFRGIPTPKRERTWMDMTFASRVMEKDGLGNAGQRRGPGQNWKEVAEREYKDHADDGMRENTDAMKQLQEDAYNLAAWDSTTPKIPELYDMHLKRVKRAQRVVAALLNLKGVGIVYCESLLVLAFFLLLPQGIKDDKLADDSKDLHRMSEASAFWILYTLIVPRVNGTYKEYYSNAAPLEGTAEPGLRPPQQPGQPDALCAYSGAMLDVMLLDCCLAYYVPQLWNKFQQLGFELSTVFYGAFMRLFATYMPTASVFRFWDLVFFRSTDPTESYARQPLINLAFGLLRSRQKELLLCNSAFEVRSLILGALNTMYDMSTVIDLALLAGDYLWSTGGFSQSKVAYMWVQRDKMFRMVNSTTMQQNEALKLVTQTKPLGSLPTVKYEKDRNILGVSTVELLKYVIPVLQTHIDRKKQATQESERKVHWGMHRSQPLAMRLLSENSFDQAQVHFTSVTHARTGHQKDLPIPKMVAPYPGSATDQLIREPFGITFGDIQDAIHQQIPSWASSGPEAQRGHASMSAPEMIFRAFNNRQDKLPGQSGEDGSEAAGFMGVLQRFMNTATGQTFPLYEANPPGVKEVVSLNDFLTAMVCCSRGTLLEKASALFSIYSYKDHRQAKGLQHRTPVSRLAKSATEGAGTNEALGRTAAPPDEESDEFRNPALKFHVKSNYPVSNCHLGEVIIPTLGPYTDYSGASPEGQLFNIWGPTPDHHRQGGRAHGAINKVCIGEMKLAIAWMPGHDDSKGQLMVRLSFIRFYSMYVTDYTRMNPWVEVYRGPWNKGVGAPVKRWDPREVFTTDAKARSWFTTDGPYGGDMKFDATMKDSMYGHNEALRHHIRSNAKDMGWNKDSETWNWNDLWGTQKSILEMKLDPECVKSQPAKVIDIFGIRMVVQSILNRTLVNLTNRQMYMIADSAFNRQANVPAILKAVLVKYGNEDKCKTMQEVEKQYGSAGLVDVTKELVLEQERQVALNGGPLIMFDKTDKDRTYNLSEWLKSVPFTFSAKRLYVRFVQGGDGERMLDYVDFESNGDVKKGKDLRLEPVEAANIPLQSRLTKEEFISCLMSSPLLSESLRRLSVIEPLRTGRKTPIQLDVTIMDPHNEEENQQVMDSLSVQQSVLFEVWDMDSFNVSKDFLGEAWLPPLQNFRERMKDIVLPLTAAAEDGDNGPSRAIDQKKVDKGVITGELYVSVKWDYPARKAEEPKPGLTEEEDRKQRAKYQQEINTGRLTIVIDKAKNLRKADSKGTKSSDPQVQVWLRNDAKSKEDSNPHSGWRSKPLFKTKTVYNNINPDWKRFQPSEHGSKTPGFDVMKGPFEMRFLPAPEGFFQEAASMLKSRHTKNKENEARITAALEKQFGESGLKVRFGAPFSDNRPGGGEGESHKVEVFLGDSIRDFKERLTEACEIESQILKSRGSMSTPYDNVKIGYRHLVMVFIPSAKLQRLYQQGLHKGQAYTDAYHQALKDPSSWQPLDPARTFSQYPQFGFGRGPTILRVIEGTERYKMSNARFKEWSKEMDKDAFIDTNSVEDGCYGWFKYPHTKDGGSTEWRPALFKKSGDNYTVDIAFDKPVQRNGGQFDLTPEQIKDTSIVMLAPRLVSIAPGPHEMHQDVLLQARSLRQSGKSDWEIENILQKLLDEQVAKEKEKPEWSESKMPPKITVDIIQQYLRQEDEKLAAKASAKP